MSCANVVLPPAQSRSDGVGRKVPDQPAALGVTETTTPAALSEQRREKLPAAHPEEPKNPSLAQ